MSQSDNASTADNGSNQSTQTNDLSPVVSELSAMRDRLETLSESHVVDADDVDVTELREELKRLEDITEEARKEVVESELRERIDIGESICGLKRIGSHNKYVTDDPGSVIARCAALGIDYTQFVDLDATALASHEADLADVGRAEYDYFL